jgi:hypothetical protein
MKMRKTKGVFPAFFLILIFVPSAALASDKKFRIDVEFGPVWQSGNDVRVPNDTGTTFSLRDVQGSGPFASGRISLDYALNPKHELRLVAAPLSLSETGSLNSPVSFAGKSFAAGPGIQTTYKFSSYRLTYRYRLYSGDRWIWKIGFTGKIRDAKIELRDSTTTAAEIDRGFVPLVHLDGEYRFANRWSFNFNMDGLAAPQGRALDVSLRATYKLSDNWSLAGGYRTLEGGADVDRVYNFTWLHYATASLAYRF